ncbi:MAG: DinB family protein [Ktedonobacteraceae bacterium]|nr:DinB family protein [Ktedonobacteraceae bacterium]
MTQERQETREEEVARVRSYLASQAMRRTSQQLVDVLREAQQQFLAEAATISDADFRTIPEEGAWSAADVLAHMCAIAAFDERSICGVIERGEQPGNVADQLEHVPASATRAQMLADMEAHRERLMAVVLHTS